VDGKCELVDNESDENGIMLSNYSPRTKEKCVKVTWLTYLSTNQCHSVTMYKTSCIQQEHYVERDR
jgi:hypothetical protein